MRYTTIIDISEFPRLYKNPNIRLLYLHIVLKAGYHNVDRDVVSISPRRIAADTGLTYGAVRHGLELLKSVGLLTVDGSILRVRKYMTQDPISPRPKTEKQATVMRLSEEEEKEKAEKERIWKEQQAKNQALRDQGKTPFMVYFEDLVEKADHGDLEAAELVKRNMQTYLAHQAAIIEEQKHKEQ